MKPWLKRTLLALAALVVVWIGAYWYFMNAYMNDMKVRSQVAEMISKAQAERRPVKIALKGAELDGHTLTLTPKQQGDQIVEWTCASDAPARLLPALCRNPIGK